VDRFQEIAPALAVNFQASFTLLNSKFKGLMSALRGE
jgi:flagellar basal body rod protein FlgB